MNYRAISLLASVTEICLFINYFGQVPCKKLTVHAVNQGLLQGINNEIILLRPILSYRIVINYVNIFISFYTLDEKEHKNDPITVNFIKDKTPQEAEDKFSHIPMERQIMKSFLLIIDNVSSAKHCINLLLNFTTRISYRF